MAGVVGDKIRLWEDISGKWNGEVAAGMYRNPIKKVLAKHRAVKKIWTIVARILEGEGCQEGGRHQGAELAASLA